MSVDVLLDTNYALWLFGGDPRGNRIREILDDAASTVTISAISWNEIAIKSSIGKLRGNVSDLRRATRTFQLLELDWTGNHAEQLAQLPMHHRDPFDRMLIAQALSEQYTIATTDRVFAAYDGLQLLESA